jgi:PTH1 family peptidyl-tRNA hydrolase
MKLIVGLGNPGLIYRGSRHNIGFSVVKALGRFYKTPFRKDSATFSLVAGCKVKNHNTILAMPLTFMNLSGLAVSALLKKYKIDLGALLIICDDLDLEFGRLKIRAYGSSGGHRGLQSIINYAGGEKFCRLRIGIGRPSSSIEAARFVLSPFNKKEKEQIKDIIEKAMGCCQVWVADGINKTMNIFNKRSKDE